MAVSPIFIPDEKTLREAALGKFRTLPRGAVRLNASADTLTRTTNLPAMGSCTAMGWVKRRGTGAGNWETAFSVVQGSSYNALYIRDNAAGLVLTLTNWSTSDSGSAVTDDVWMHLTMTIAGNGAGQFLAYLNGVEDISHTGAITGTMDTLRIGSTADVEWANANFANVRIWNRALSAAEVKREYASPVPVTWKGLNAWYPMAHHSTVRLDYAFSRHLTLAGTFTTESGPPFPLAWVRRRSRVFVAAGGSVSGELAQTLGAVTSTATGTVEVQGTASPTLGAVTSTATGTVDITGQATPTLGALTTTATGTVDIAGTASPTLGALTTTAAGTVDIAGQCTTTLGALTSTATGTVEVKGDLAQTLGALTATGAEGDVEVKGETGGQLAPVTLSGTGVVGDPPVEGTLSATLGAATSTAAGTVEIQGQATPTLGALSSAATGTVDIAGSAIPTLAAVTTTATGTVSLSGTLTATLGALTLAGTSAETEIDIDEPPGRTWRIPLITRTWAIARQSRTWRIPHQDREYEI